MNTGPLSPTRRSALEIRPASEADRTLLHEAIAAAGFSPLCHAAGWRGYAGLPAADPAIAGTFIATRSDGPVVGIGYLDCSGSNGEGRLTVLARPGAAHEVLGSGLIAALAGLARERGCRRLTTILSSREPAIMETFHDAGLRLRARLSFPGATEIELWPEGV